MFPQFDKLIPEEFRTNTDSVRTLGFAHPESAVQSLTAIRVLSIARQGRVAGGSDHWYGSLQRVLQEAPLKDTVLSVVEQFVRNATEHFDPFRLFEQTPRALDILARIACGSPFLTQTLLADPSSLTSLTARGRTAEMKSREQFVNESQSAVSSNQTRARRLTDLRRYQRRELLRIGMCDAFGLLDLRFVTLQLSLLADAMVQICLNLACDETGVPADRIAIIALGKHGGEELNYSSDIDLVLISDHESSDVQRLARLTIDGLADNLPPGFLYRVDLRLRPWGDAGPLVSSIDAYADYLRNDAALWEKQALLKARPIAGNARLGVSFLKTIRPLLFLDSAERIRTGIQQMKERIEVRLRQRGKLDSEVKLGIGSIRDVEFLVQYLQLTHGRTEPRILSFNTLDSLVRLAEFGLLNASWYRQLRAGYVFLRTIEHSLQLLHNQQTHELPADDYQREWLANRLDYPDARTLMLRFDEHRHAIRTVFNSCLQETKVSTVQPAVSGSLTPAITDTNLSAPPLGVDTASNVQSAESGKADYAQQQIDELARQSVAGMHVGVRLAVESSDNSSSLLTWRLIICGLEIPGWLSIICGLQSIYRLDIRRGEAITGGGMNRYGHRCPEDRFLAVFHVQTDRKAAFSSGDQEIRLQQELTDLWKRLAAGDVESVRSELISRFCETVPRQPNHNAGLAQIRMDVEQDARSDETRLKITGTDAHGFLFELAHALFLSRFRIVRAIVDSDDLMIRDVLHVTELDGSPITSESRLQELKVVVVLIKQFFYWLPTTSDPHHALIRFRELIARLQPASHWSRDVQSLQRPDVLHAVARVLGISQFLWEEFLRSRHEELFPLLADAEGLNERVLRPALLEELSEQPASENAVESGWTRLNTFKDRHLFRIDMRHLLGHCRPFGVFSEEITELAEIVVCRAIQLGWEQQTTDHGEPMIAGSDSSTARLHRCPYAVAGLGKFGGVEMGFASDIELMVVYAGSGMTSGPNAISNARFFDLLVAAVAGGISARKDGIFHVDLRMRPFGQAGSAAVMADDFNAYYGVNGPAWPYERQALVKFRCVAGDSNFCALATANCHQAIYTAGTFDFAAMRAMRERQVRQLVRGGTINAKLSDGGLVDCEYAVQALQLTFGGRMPTLRHPNTRRALNEAARLSLIAPSTRTRVENAYVFLRELIDCLRMVRGNARDLTVPEPGTPDYHHLAHRMRTIHDSRTPLDQLESQMAIIREFSQEVQQHCRTMRLR